jgi:hypothetical protein
MPVLRTHTVLLDQSGTTPITGPSYSLIPSDADAVTDANHTFVALVSLSRPLASPVPGPLPAPIPDGGPTLPGTPSLPRIPTLPGTPTVPTPTPTPTASGALSVLVEGSFDQVHWVLLGLATLPADASALDELVELGPMPPVVRTRVLDTSDDAIEWTAYVALAATAPYRARVVA